MATTRLKIVLDRSGSMHSIAAVTVDKLNEYLNKVNVERGKEKILVSLYQFDNIYLVSYEDVPIEDVVPLVNGDTYMPRGMTALLDAIGKTVSGDGGKLKKKEKGICVIITDGWENCSREYTNESVSALIKDLEDNSAWSFVFLGANQDAFNSANKFGIRDESSTLSYGASVEGVGASFASLATATVSRAAQSSSAGMSTKSGYFTDDMVKEVKKTIKKK